jgi:hypothetical protein
VWVQIEGHDEEFEENGAGEYQPEEPEELGCFETREEAQEFLSKLCAVKS